MKHLYPVFNRAVVRKKQVAWTCLIAMHTLMLPTFADEIAAVNKPKVSLDKEIVKSLKTEPSLEKKGLSSEEALLLKRIDSYWQEQDFISAKREILNFLQTYPNSSTASQLYAMLGDLSLTQKEYKEALSFYEQIQDKEFKTKSQLNKIQTLFVLNYYDEVNKEAEIYLKQTDKKKSQETTYIRYLYAESLFQKISKEQDLQKQKQWAAAAKKQFSSLDSTDYKEVILFPLAETARILENYPQAAELYLKLCKIFPERQEELLFQAASMQVKFDPSAACNTFGKIYKLNQKWAKAAALDQMILLFQMKRYADLLQVKDQALIHIPEEKLPLIQFYIGKSYFALGDYTHAIVAFKTFLPLGHQFQSEQKNALLSLIACAKNTQDLVLFEEGLNTLASSFPQDIETAKAFQMHAKLCLEKKQPVKAKTTLKKLLIAFPEHEEKALILFDYALLAYQQKQWSEAKGAFFSYVEQFSTEPKVPSAYRMALNCSINQLKETSIENKPTQQVVFTEDLKKVLQVQEVLSESEKTEFCLTLAKMLYDLGEFAQTLDILENFAVQFPHSSSLSEVYYLMALCDQKNPSRYKHFIDHAEKALVFDALRPEAAFLRLQLFNIYHSLAQKETEKEPLLAKAASHLYKLASQTTTPIKLQNQIWLANYFYKKARTDQEALQTSLFLYERLLGKSADELKIHIANEEAVLEKEIFKYSELLEISGKGKQKIQLLETLLSYQKEHPGFPWKYPRHAVLELARAYAHSEDPSKALKLYDELIHTSYYSSSYTAKLANLEHARLKYALLPSIQKQENDAEMISILNCLKDLEVQKNLYSEPLHLEASLEYIDVKSSFETVENTTEKKLFLFKRFKENFNALNNDSALEYHQLRDELPEKDRVFQAYMKYADAEILYLESLLATKEQQKENAELRKRQALRQFDELLKESSLPDSLILRINRSKEAIKKT